MKRILLRSKIHNATVTETYIDYEGSLALDETLMKAAEMLPFEEVHVFNVSNGERFSTYLIKGKKDTGMVGIYGAAAHKANAGDRLIVVSYVLLDEEEIEFFMPKILTLDEKNKIIRAK